MKIKDFPLDLVTEYNNRNISVRKIAQNYKCSQSTVKRFLERNGGDIITKTQYLSEIKTLSDTLVDEISALYRSYMSMPEIARKYDVTMPTLRAYFIRHNISYKTSEWIAEKVLFYHKDMIINMYKECKSLAPIARRFNCSSKTIANFFDRYVINRKKNGRNHIPESDKEKIHEMHYKQMMTMAQIGKIYNCSAPTVAEFFDKHNIDRRPKSVTSALTAQNPLTIQKQNRSLFTHKSYSLPSGKIIKVQGYEPQFLDYVFRNNLLHESEIIYNPKRIPYNENGKQRYYFPDFYIPHLNLIIEVKSSWIYKKQGIKNNKLKEMATKNSGFNYLLVLDNDYSLLNMTITPCK